MSEDKRSVVSLLSEVHSGLKKRSDERVIFDCWVRASSRVTGEHSLSLQNLHLLSPVVLFQHKWRK